MSMASMLRPHIVNFSKSAEVCVHERHPCFILQKQNEYFVEFVQGQPRIISIFMVQISQT